MVNRLQFPLIDQIYIFWSDLSDWPNVDRSVNYTIFEIKSRKGRWSCPKRYFCSYFALRHWGMMPMVFVFPPQCALFFLLFLLFLISSDTPLVCVAMILTTVVMRGFFFTILKGFSIYLKTSWFDWNSGHWDCYKMRDSRIPWLQSGHLGVHLLWREMPWEKSILQHLECPTNMFHQLPSNFSKMDPPKNKEKRGRGQGQGQSRDVQVSKALSLLLRHAAEKEGLKMNVQGYASVTDVVCSILPRF